MINVRVKRLNKPAGNDLTKAVMTPIANALAETVAKHLQERVKGFTCEDHPGFNSTITVEAVREKHPVINKNSLCCQKLKDRISVTFNGRS